MGTLSAFYSPLSAGEWLLFAFFIAISLLIGIVLAKRLDKNKIVQINKRLIPTLLFVSIGIELLAALYLLIFEPTLLNSAPIYWGMLLVYTSGNIILLELFLFCNRKGTLRATTVWSFLGILGILLAAGLNFPFSQLYGYGGVSYVFGFGTGGIGSFGVSFSLLLILVFSVVTLFSSHLKSLEEKKKRKR
jgi:preprotein translocase subunit SecG